MDEEKKIFKLVSKDKPPEENPGVTVNQMLEQAKDKYDNIILVGWEGDHFKISWSEDFTPDEVYVLLELAKERLLNKMYSF